MKKTAILLILIGLAFGIAIALTGCGSKGERDTSETTPSAEETSPTAASPAEPEAPVVVEGPAVSPGEETVEESEPDALDIFAASLQALRSLTSYRYETVITYSGTGESGTLTVRGEYSAPDSHHITIIDSENGTRTEFIKIGDSFWMYNDSVGWTEIPAEAAAAMSQTMSSFALEFVWGGLVEGVEEEVEYMGRETVNGVRTLHYSVSDTSWQEETELEVGEARGDIWIADEGYVVRFVFTASGTDEEGNTGSVEWRTEVTEVNSPVDISPPTGG